MASVSHIWFFCDQKQEKQMQVTVNLRPAGTVDIKVSIPPQFYDAIINMAQLAADAHEAEMRMHILGENYDQNA